MSMREVMETLLSCVKHEVEGGIEHVDTKEMGEVIDMIYDLAQAEYYVTVVDAMHKGDSSTHEGNADMMKKM